jgi:hypothetical protein
MNTRRTSPELGPETMAKYIAQRDSLDNSSNEDKVSDLFKRWVLPDPFDPAYAASGLEYNTGMSMSSHLTPAYPGLPSLYKVSQPKPDFVYGYSGSDNSPFTGSHNLAMDRLDQHPNQEFAKANASGLQFPFFAIELKADAGTFGCLWVATNQCAGDAGACLNAAERLNDLLAEAGGEMLDNLTYCVAADNSFAHLYVSWKPERLRYYLHEIGAYRLSYEEDFKEFRRQVRNIIDWGRDERLRQIKASLDFILEEERKSKAREAKARPPPSAGSSSSTGPPSKRGRASSSSTGGRGGGQY